MKVQRFTRGDKVMFLHRLQMNEHDEDEGDHINEYWECRVEGGKTHQFSSWPLCWLFINSNEWQTAVDV